MQIPRIRNKKGQGLIMGLVMGVAALVIAVIIAFVIITNVVTVEESLAGTSSHLGRITNESGHINGTDYTVAQAGITGFTNPIIVKAHNATDGTIIDSGNYTITDAGVISNTTLSHGYDSALLTYTYNYKGTTVTTENLRANFTKGIDNVSSKIPTVLLIAAVVLILGVLVLLWTQYKRMDIGGGDTGNL